MGQELYLVDKYLLLATILQEKVLSPVHTLKEYLHILQAKTLHTSCLSIQFDIPRLSSASASGKSKGGLFVSASAEMKNITNIGKRGITYHNSVCAITMSLSLMNQHTKEHL